VSIALVGILFVLIVVAVIVVAGRAWRSRLDGEADDGVDIIPYLLLALAVGTAGFTLASLARASLTTGQLTGRPTAEIAGALAALVVSAPIAFLLWRRQARRRQAYPETAGWPVYLAIIELVFLTAFLVAVWNLAEVLSGDQAGADWTDLVVYGGIVVFHWWVARREPPPGDLGELPRLIGSGVALIATTGGLIGTSTWLFTMAYDAVWGHTDIPDLAEPLALLAAAGPIWAYRWLPDWDQEPGPLRNFYVGLATTATLVMAIGATVTVVVTILTFLLADPGPAAEHFAHIPLTLAVLIWAGALWWHHMTRLGPGRSGARRGYQYAMTAIGLASLVGSSVGLVEAAFTPTLAGADNTATLLTLGCVVIAAGWVWLHFWRRCQAASPREIEARSVARRFYLVGMAIVFGLTAAGSLIAVLVIVFRALLGEVEATASGLRLPVTLTIFAGLATWHLIDQIRDDRATSVIATVKPFTVTVVCSQPGDLWQRFPKEARVRVLYRDDTTGVIDEDMASAIVAAVDGTSSLVWVDEEGFRVARARET
jgi:hypothetical protein